MAIENAVMYVLADVPTLILAKVLRRRLQLPAKKAQAIAMSIFFSFILGSCFLAWFFSQSQ